MPFFLTEDFCRNPSLQVGGEAFIEPAGERGNKEILLNTPIHDHMTKSINYIAEKIK